MFSVCVCVSVFGCRVDIDVSGPSAVLLKANRREKNDARKIETMFIMISAVVVFECERTGYDL